MATPQEQREEVKKLNREIQELYSNLGRQDLPPIFDPKQLQQAKDLVVGLKSQLGAVKDDLSFIAGSFRDAINSLSKQNTELGKVRSSMGSISRISTQIAIENEDLSKVDIKRVNTLEKRAKAQFESLRIAKLSGTLSKEANDEADFALRQENLFLESIKQIRKEQEQINKNSGVRLFSGIEDLTNAIPGLGKLTPMFSEASKAAKETAAFNLKTYSNVKGMDKKQYAEKVKQSKDVFDRELNQLSKLSKFNKGKGKNQHLSVNSLQKTDIGRQILSKTKGKGGTAAAAVAKKMGGALELKGPAKIAKSISPLMAGLKTLGPALSKALGPLSLIIDLVSAFFKVNKETVELQKGMALSATEANSFRANLGIAAANTGDINITASKLLKSFSALNKQFGFITNFASQTLVTMTRLTDVVGVSSEAAGNLAAASTLTGKSFESNYKDVLGTSYELQRQEGVQFDLREILEETGKVTGTVRANLGANPANIAKAITQSKLFGASLQQVANAGKSLLDFESSITSELEAELLLGRDINLEKARLAALNGDQVTLAKELRKEAGDYDDFMKMNVLQQESLAKAMGMQSDELADILFKQDIQGKTAKELRALGKDELADRLEAQTVQDKFNASVEKLKEIFADVATALMPIFEVFGSIVQLVGLILSPFTAVINAATKFSPILGIIIGLLTAAATAAIVMNSALTFGVGTAIALAAAGGAIMLLNNNKKEAQPAADINSPAKGKTQISTKEGGLFELSPNDDIIAAPGASAAMARATQPQQTTVVQQDNSESKRTNTLLEQILSKQGTIKLDSTDMGTAMSVNRYAIQ
jgi:hypothetical protein